MKILHIIASVNPAGGGPMEGIKQIAKMLTKMGHIVEVLTLDSPIDPWIKNVEFKVYPVGPGITRYGYTPRFMTWLKENYQNYDACIINGIWMYHSFAAWTLLRNSDKPYYVFTHGMLDPWFKKNYPFRHLRKSMYWPWAEHRVLTDARAVCFTCDDERLLARQSFKPYRIREAVVSYGTSFPTGDADSQKAAFVDRFPEVRGKKLLLYLSRIHEKKGCDLLIEAFGNVAKSDPDLHLMVAGPDHYRMRPELEQIARRLGVANRISWPGMIDGDIKWGAFRFAEAFILPSHQENFGIVVAEAMACGCAVLISNKVNIWREIELDGSGLVANDDLEGTVDLMNRWLTMTEQQKRAMKEHAVESFASRYEIKHVADSFIGLLASTENENAASGVVV
jgi:glycosyltransferase involved in cell wall biosynthesis